ncbi:uncharacterized protein LOC135963493 [Calliphora vicina]|uniref:uncharacterized protein LOC135963493 n=1 Tax=Calliphora vicina TaxID=7373 RepID=UPI00325A480F
MERKLQILILILGSLVNVFGDLPPEIQKCKSSDNDDCIAKSIMKIMELYPHGNTEFGLPNISAVALKELVFAESNRDAPIQLNFKFNTLVVGGLEKLHVTRIHGFNKNISKTVELDFLIPQVTIDGDYKMNGKLLLLPLNGKGKGKVQFKETVFKFKVKIELENRNNKNYGVIKKLKCWSIEPKKIVFNLQNIVNNNAMLSESFNSVINDNWSELWKELKKNTIKAVEDVITNIISGILNVLPITEFYSD